MMQTCAALEFEDFDSEACLSMARQWLVLSPHPGRDTLRNRYSILGGEPILNGSSSLLPMPRAGQ
jgi:hypothetical protein